MAPMGGHLVGPTGSRSECYRLGSTTMTISSTTAMTGGTTEPRAVIKAADVFPDLHHKMSKKIAQLTKVIYHLNTKNEDRQARPIRNIHNHGYQHRLLAVSPRKGCVFVGSSRWIVNVECLVCSLSARSVQSNGINSRNGPCEGCLQSLFHNASVFCVDL